MKSLIDDDWKHDARENYEYHSSKIGDFIQDYCEKDKTSQIIRSKFDKEFNKYLRFYERGQNSPKRITLELAKRGFLTARRTDGKLAVIGLRWYL